MITNLTAMGILLNISAQCAPMNEKHLNFESGFVVVSSRMVWFLGAGSGGHLAPNCATHQKLKTQMGLKFRFVLTGGSFEGLILRIDYYPLIFIYMIALLLGI